MAESQTGILNSERCPQFFKFYMPAHCSTQLRVPPAFIKYFGDYLPFKFTLITSRNSWEVDMNKIDDDVFFKTGWEKFVQDNLLEFGDFLIFYYHGGSKFYVSISEKNNCLKEIKIPNNNVENQPIKIPNNNIENQPIKIPNNNIENQPIKIPNNNTENQPIKIPNNNTENQPNVTVEQIEDNNLSFEIKIQPSHMAKGYLAIPKVFYNGLKGYRPVAKLQHLGRTWDLKVANSGDRIQLTNGWNLFAMENCLSVGDICSFKMVDIKPEFYLMDVSFSREI